MYLIRLRIGLSRSLICDCVETTETINSSFLHSSNLIHESQPILQNIENINPSCLLMNETCLIQLLLYGYRGILYNNNIFLLNLIIDCLLSTKRYYDA